MMMTLARPRAMRHYAWKTKSSCEDDPDWGSLEDSAVTEEIDGDG